MSFAIEAYALLTAKKILTESEIIETVTWLSGPVYRPCESSGDTQK